MSRLRCKEEHCEGRDQPLFSINGVVVYEDAKLAERLDKAPAEYFECAHCHGLVEWVEEPVHEETVQEEADRLTGCEA